MFPHPHAAKPDEGGDGNENGKSIFSGEGVLSNQQITALVLTGGLFLDIKLYKKAYDDNVRVYKRHFWSAGPRTAEDGFPFPGWVWHKICTNNDQWWPNTLRHLAPEIHWYWYSYSARVILTWHNVCKQECPHTIHHKLAVDNFISYTTKHVSCI